MVDAKRRGEAGEKRDGQTEMGTTQLAVSPRRVGDGPYDEAHEPHARRGLALHRLLSVRGAPRRR